MFPAFVPSHSPAPLDLQRQPPSVRLPPPSGRVLRRRRAWGRDLEQPRWSGCRGASAFSRLRGGDGTGAVRSSHGEDRGGAGRQTLRWAGRLSDSAGQIASVTAAGLVLSRPSTPFRGANGGDDLFSAGHTSGGAGAIRSVSACRVECRLLTFRMMGPEKAVMVGRRPGLWHWLSGRCFFPEGSVF